MNTSCDQKSASELCLTSKYALGFVAAPTYVFKWG